MENAPELFSILLKLQQMEGTEERAGLIMIRISDLLNLSVTCLIMIRISDLLNLSVTCLIMIRISDLLNLSVTSQPAEMILKVDVTIASVS